MELGLIKNNAKDYGIPIIRTESHKLLEKIVSENQPKRILEIGTAVGYSGILMLKSSKHSSLVTIEHNRELAREARRNFKKEKVSKRAKIIVSDCMIETAKMVASKQFDGQFDMIFLDGPKAQYELILDNLVMLLASGGTLVADNVLFRGYVSGEENAPTKRYKTIIKRLNNFIEKCKNHSDLKNVKVIKIEDGMIQATKR